jgi:hypothetical protein
MNRFSDTSLKSDSFPPRPDGENVDQEAKAGAGVGVEEEEAIAGVGVEEEEEVQVQVVFETQDAFADAMMKKYRYTVETYKFIKEKQKALKAISFPGRCILAFGMVLFISVCAAAAFLFDWSQWMRFGFYVFMLVAIYLGAKAVHVF